ncbi:MAG: hypothetical protein AAGA56_29680 [Myxococcota bacterium]
MRRTACFALTALLTVPACRVENDEPLTAAEAAQALDELSIASQASTLAGSSVELSTNFTIGQAAEAAADELRTFIETQLPCAEITLADRTLSVEYGARPGSCTYNGNTYSGTHSITVDSAERGSLQVSHTWTDMSNGRVSVEGTATVTWGFDDGLTRRVEHELNWTRTFDGKTGTGRGDRLQRTLDGGLLEGIAIDGNRSWEGSRGEWDLEIAGVEARWIDPVPQAGAYTLTTPNDKRVSVSFERLDEDTITVTLAGSGDRSFSFDVSRLGLVEES